MCVNIYAIKEKGDWIWKRTRMDIMDIWEGLDEGNGRENNKLFYNFKNRRNGTETNWQKNSTSKKEKKWRNNVQFVKPCGIWEFS